MARSTYRTISKTSTVDESLFGYSKPGTTRATSSNTVEKIPDAMGTSRSGTSRSGTSRSGGPGSPFALTGAALERMRKPASVLSSAQIEEIKRTRRAAYDAEAEASKARKERMLATESTRGAVGSDFGSESEQLKAMRAEMTKSRAQTLLDEQLDEVKNMNQMMLYSKCVTIRDAQLEEKKHVKAEAAEEERRLDVMMEVERLKALDLYQAREAQRALDRRKGAEVLQKQIAERTKERELQDELLDMDRKLMLSEIQRMKDEADADGRRKKEAGQKLLAEVSKANAAQLERKKLMVQSEREEEERIARYIAERDEREAREQAEKERVAREKELETARLRAQQEKHADTAAAMDELRAQRIQEAHERAYREKERAAAERERAINEDLRVAREYQKMLKMKQLSDQARQERDEFFRVIDVQMQKEEEDAAQAVQLAAMRKQHKEELQSQIAYNEEMRRRERREYLEEGDRVRSNLTAERARLEAIKQRKLEELAASGVPEKYLSELAKKKIAV